MILNVDGSSLDNPNISSFGELIRNSDDAWFHEFVGNIGFSNILHVELLMVYHGNSGLGVWYFEVVVYLYYSDSTTIKLIS